ncbi:MAG: hypothetical protein FJZ47_26010 [Candidatus Tectomicrobia bacterium]|uniref:Uncharacterized protein n=1 Tax=Tectimicrobiota bacterium TaxID=2528274 RepID=A0A937W603_UNCTE|nr:hypothetical protein [Candidatus Tectomicrobia bacterium]
MPIMTIHRILIASGIFVCLAYAAREITTYNHTASGAAALHAALAVMAAIALGVYLRSIRKR